jgi:hypothetical protein
LFKGAGNSADEQTESTAKRGSSVTMNQTLKDSIDVVGHVGPRDDQTIANQQNADWAKPTALLERRRHQRYPMRGQITLRRTGDDPEATGHPIWPLEIHDLSVTGLGGVCQVELKAGEPVLVFITSDGMDPRFEQAGHIVRCEAVDDQATAWRIGVQFDSSGSAA